MPSRHSERFIRCGAEKKERKKLFLLLGQNRFLLKKLILFFVRNQCDRTKLPNVYKSCLRMLGDLGKLIVNKGFK